jgi:uncharacterized OsmC-like protein
MKNSLIALVCLMLAGCAAQQGNHILADVKHEDLKAKLTEGKTTAEEVRKLFGDPVDTRMNLDGSEEWVYELVRADAKATSYIPIVNLFASGADTDKKTLRVLFDKKGILVKYIYSSSKGEFKQGVF